MPSSLVKTVVFVLLASIGSFLFGLLNDLDVFKPLPAPSLGGETSGGTTTTTTPPGFVCRTLARETAIGKKGNYYERKKKRREVEWVKAGARLGQRDTAVIPPSSPPSISLFDHRC